MNKLQKAGLAGLVALSGACNILSPESTSIRDLRATPSVVDAGQPFTVSARIESTCEPVIRAVYNGAASKYIQNDKGTTDVNILFNAQENGYVHLIAGCGEASHAQDSVYVSVRPQ